MHRLLLLALLTVLLCCAPAAAAHAQGGLGGPNVPSPLLQEDPDAESQDGTDLDESTGMTLVSKLLIFGGTALAIGAIGWFILRDARRRAPTEEPRTRAEKAAEDALPAPERARRQRNRKRAAGKRAKQSRKRNRSR